MGGGLYRFLFHISFAAYRTNVFCVCLFNVLPAMEMRVVSSTTSYSRFAT
jgi:hypothetical protein